MLAGWCDKGVKLQSICSSVRYIGPTLVEYKVPQILTLPAWGSPLDVRL